MITYEIIQEPNPSYCFEYVFTHPQFFNFDISEMECQNERYASKIDSHVIAKNCNNVIVGHLGIVTRIITFDDKIINVGGFGGVCVHSKFRHQGIAQNMLKIGMNVLNGMKCDIAFLSTDKFELYEKVGFHKLGRTYSAIGKSGTLYCANDGMIAPVLSNEIFLYVKNSNTDFYLCGHDW